MVEVQDASLSTKPCGLRGANILVELGANYRSSRCRIVRLDQHEWTGRGLPEQRLASGLPKPITAPCGSLTQLVPTQAPLPGHSLGSPSPASAAAHAPRHGPPKKIATFNTHTEALEPMVDSFGAAKGVSSCRAGGNGRECPNVRLQP
jgi:hypothetical protein